MPQHHAGTLAERQPAQRTLDVDDRRHIRIVDRVPAAARRPEQRDPAPLAHRAADPGPRHVGDDTARVRHRVVGVPDPVPAVPERQQGVGRQIVGGIGLTGQQMGQPGEFGVMGLEELVELGGSGIGMVDGCAHSYLSLRSRSGACAGRTVYVPSRCPRGAAGRERTSAPRKRFDAGVSPSKA